MPAISIPFQTNNQNTSLQIGDILYFIPYSSINNFSYNNNLDDLKIIGALTQIDETSGSFIVNGYINAPQANDFLMFQKSKSVNNASMIGYYAEVQFKNSSLEKAELFAVSSEVTPSSK